MTMSEPNAPGSREDDNAKRDAGDELQFDQAEYTTPAPDGPSCGVCKRSIDDAYFEFNGKVICTTCRQQVEAAFRGGSRLARVIAATIFGSVAAVAGAALYYAIIRITGYNIGLVAIVVGVMVGSAVRKGASYRGGLFYQFLSLFLAYMAIGLMHVPMLVEDWIKTQREQAQQANILPEKSDKDLAKVDGEPKAPVTRELAKGDALPKAAVTKDRAKVDGQAKAPVIAANDRARPQAGTAPSPPAGAVGKEPVPDPKQKGAVVEGKNQHVVDGRGKPDAKPPQFSLVRILVLLVLAIVLVFSLPVVAAFADPISAVIYCFALWTAWGINKAARLAFKGPFRVSKGDSNEPEPEDVDDGG
jgi:hypothetical protein